MAKYGTRRYGTFVYGQPDTLGVYYNSKLVAKVYDYKSTYVSWSPIIPDPSDPAPTHWKLVKSFSGAPDNPFSATKVVGGTMAEFITDYYELFTEELGKEINYSLWIFNGERWIFCGADDTVVVDETTTLKKLVNWIPRAWLNEKKGIGDEVGEAEASNQLVKVLSGYSLMYDKLSTEAKIVEGTSNKLGISNSLVASKVVELGFNYEPSLGDNYHRSLYGAGNQINSEKGTTTAVNTFTTSLTHWQSNVVVGHNILLNYNDSSFEEGIGNWGITGPGTLVTQTFESSLDDIGVLVAMNDKALIDPLYPPRAIGFGLLTTEEDSVVTLTLPAAEESFLPHLYGTPVSPNTPYLFTGWIKDLDDISATVGCKINWYDYRDNYLGFTPMSTSVTTTNAWQEFTSYNEAGRQGAMSPNTAAYAVIDVYVLSESNVEARYALDMLQLSKAEDSYEFEDARRVRVYVKGDQENYTLNPSFESGLGFWHASSNANIAQDSTAYPSSLKFGNSACEITVVDGVGAYVHSDWVALDPDQNYTFTGFVSSGYAESFRTSQARMEFSNRASIEQQSQVITDGNGSYFNDDPYYLDSEIVELSFHYVADETSTVELNPEDWPVGSWDPELLYYDPFYGSPQAIPNKVKFQVSGITPPKSKDSGNPLVRLTVFFPDAEPGDVFWLDGAMLQESSEGNDFFCGGGANLPTDPVDHVYFPPSDCVWEIKNRFNYASNSSFETTDDWTELQGTLNLVTSGEAPERVVNINNSLGGLVLDTLTSEPIMYPYESLYGTYMGQVTFGTFGDANPGGEGEIVTVVSLPSEAKGGEDFVVSAYVRSGEGDYTITANPGLDNEVSKTITVIEHDQYKWVRLHLVCSLAAGDTEVEVVIKLTQAAASLGLPQTNYFNIDGFQAEYGRIPTAFIDPDESRTKYMPNPGNTDKTMHMNQVQSDGGGKSSYFDNYFTKVSRLYESLNLVLPNGSTWCVKSGFPTLNYQGELEASLIPSASFEKDLGEWSGLTASLTRTESRGVYENDSTVQGAFYCRVESTKLSSSGDNTWGITTSSISVLDGQGYYGSVAVRPSSDSLGDYTLTTTFYGPDDSVIQEYLSTVSLANSGDPEDRDVTGRWNYVGGVYPAAETLGATYVVLKIECDPSSFVAGQYFDIDRCIFRQ